MSVVNSQATLRSTPDPGQGGNPVTGDSNTGHASTTSSLVDTGSEIKTCVWTDFRPIPNGQILGVVLKYDWAHSGNFFLSSETGEGSASISVQIQYSINGGSNWTTSRTAGDSGVVIGNDTDSGSIPNTSGSDSIALPITTLNGLKNVRVRDRILATLSLIGDCAGTAAATLAISNIRLEVTYAELQPITIW
jgi:hypothetical protein